MKDLPQGLLKATFGVYLGWICIATIANVTALLVDVGWGGFGLSPQVWTVILIVIGATIVCLAIIKTSNPFIGLSAIWAFVGIILKRSDDYRIIVLAAALGILMVGILTILIFFGKKLS